MIVSVPACARGEEPVTGASTNAISRFASAAAIRCVHVGPIVEQSMHSVCARAVHDALLAQQHVLDLGTVDDHRHDDIGLDRRLGRRRSDRSAVLGRERLRARPRPVPDRQLEPGAAQVRGHPRAHDPEA
jgi:hypothetical protein